jgi:hypothetical protein
MFCIGQYIYGNRVFQHIKCPLRVHFIRSYTKNQNTNIMKIVLFALLTDKYTFYIDLLPKLYVW